MPDALFYYTQHCTMSMTPSDCFEHTRKSKTGITNNEIFYIQLILLLLDNHFYSAVEYLRRKYSIIIFIYFL